MRGENNRGTLMVEAAFIYPLFLFTIIAMLVLGLLKLEQTLVQELTAFIKKENFMQDFLEVRMKLGTVLKKN